MPVQNPEVLPCPFQGFLFFLGCQHFPQFDPIWTVPLPGGYTVMESLIGFVFNGMALRNWWTPGVLDPHLQNGDNNTHVVENLMRI